MAEDSEDDSSKTEEPSQKKLEEAAKKGQVISSREINHFFIILALTFFVLVLAPGVMRNLYIVLAPFIVEPEAMEVSGAGFQHLVSNLTFGVFLALALPMLMVITAAIAPSVVQRKWVFAVEQIKPKLEKISPLSGFKRVFGLRSMVEFLKNLLKVSIIGTTAALVALPYRDDLVSLPGMSEPDLLSFIQHVAGEMLIAACLMLFLLSIIDYYYQRFMFLKKMRMTKQEVKDEYKQQEGDPHIKQKLRAIRREKARKRMMANVPKADVVITNPTHFAVALQYDAMSMQAPLLLAKGADDVAARIREVAAKHKVPIVRNPPLARVLYDTTEVDEEIPVEHYQAVAKVIGYVYKLKGKVPVTKMAGKAPAGGKGAKDITPGKPTLKTRK